MWCCSSLACGLKNAIVSFARGTGGIVAGATRAIIGTSKRFIRGSGAGCGVCSTKVSRGHLFRGLNGLIFRSFGGRGKSFSNRGRALYTRVLRVRNCVRRLGRRVGWM